MYKRQDVQYAMYRTVSGLENVKIVRNAYAIEYDCINSRQLKPTLEFKAIQGLFSGGQFNGSSVSYTHLDENECGDKGRL